MTRHAHEERSEEAAAGVDADRNALADTWILVDEGEMQVVACKRCWDVVCTCPKDPDFHWKEARHRRGIGVNR